MISRRYQEAALLHVVRVILMSCIIKGTQCYHPEIASIVNFLPKRFPVLPMQRPHNDSDEDLCIGVREGNQGSFRSLFDKYYGSLFRFFCHRGMDRALAEDMAQDIFVRVWQNRNTLNPSKSIKAYLFQAAANEIRMHFRKKKVRDQYARDVQQQSLSYSVPIADFDKKQHIQQAIQALPPPLKEVFVLHRYDGLSYKEIAQLHQVSVKTVESRMSKALKKLRTQLSHLVKLAVAFFLWIG